ncbi:15197_t:CDS:1, partial [Cetraspora pellucida]
DGLKLIKKIDEVNKQLNEFKKVNKQLDDKIDEYFVKEFYKFDENMIDINDKIVKKTNKVTEDET